MTHRLACCLILALACGVEARVWTDVQGRQVEGDLVGANGQGVTLRLLNGRQVQVTLGSLCVADQRFVRQVLAQNEGAEGREEDGNDGDEQRRESPGKDKVRLPIPDRKPSPDAPKNGWSGEACLQMVLMYCGAYVPQKQISTAAGSGRGKGLLYTQMYPAMRQLGLSTLTYKTGRTNAAEFHQWAREQIDEGRAIVTGVKVYPDKAPGDKVDQIVVISGYDKDGLFLNTNVANQGVAYRTMKQLSSTKEGISLANRSATIWAESIKGLDSSGRPVTVAAGDESGRNLSATITCRDLRRGQRYVLFRRQSPREHNGIALSRFQANGDQYTYSDSIGSGDVWHYECVETNDGSVKGMRLSK